jgi:hypothetical protein
VEAAGVAYANKLKRALEIKRPPGTEAASQLFGDTIFKNVPQERDRQILLVFVLCATTKQRELFESSEVLPYNHLC